LSGKSVSQGRIKHKERTEEKLFKTKKFIIEIVKTPTVIFDRIKD
jgi:hypothetical protein